MVIILRNSDSIPPFQPIKLNLSVLLEGKYYPLFNLLTSRDSITVYLRDAAFPYAVRDSTKGVIDSLNFSSLITFTNTPSGRYYIVVKHFQSMETWSKSGGDSLIEDGVLQNYNFTTGASQAYGNNLKTQGW